MSEPRIAAWIGRSTDPSRAISPPVHRPTWQDELCRGASDYLRRRERLAAYPGVQLVICIDGVDVTCYGPGGRSYVPNVEHVTSVYNRWREMSRIAAA